MDLSQIKQLVKRGGNKIILVENDEAELVVMSFAEYERLVAPSFAPAAAETMAGEKATEGKVGAYISPASPMPMSPSVATIKSARPAITFEEMRDAAMRLEDVQLKDLPIEEAWG